MRILALSDTHFGHMYGNTAHARKEIIDSKYSAFENVLKIAEDEGVDVVLHGGDMFNRSKPPKKVISNAYNILEKLTKSKIKFLGIPGNHDKSILPETLLNHLNENIYFQNRLAREVFGDISVISFPFATRNPQIIFEKIRRKIANYPKQSFIVLCHQIFNGATFGPHQYMFKNRTDALLTENFSSNALLFLSGHIHRAQRIQNNRVYYTGSIERTSFMETIESKGCLLIDVEPNNVEVKFVELPSEPMKTIELDIENVQKFSKKLDTLAINKEVKTLIRLTGRSLEQDEIKFLWSYFSAKEFPYLSFSPRRPFIQLKPLYTNSYLPINLDKYK